MSALVLPCSVVDDQHWWLIGPGQQCPESPFFDIHFTNRPDSEQALKLLSSPLSPLLSSLRWIAVSHVSCALVKVSRIGLFGPQTICGLYLYKEFLLPRDNKIEKWYSYKCRGIYTPLMNCTMECTEPLRPHFFILVGSLKEITLPLPRWIILNMSSLHFTEADIFHRPEFLSPLSNVIPETYVHELFTNFFGVCGNNWPRQI